jgi:hypothetical protein
MNTSLVVSAPRSFSVMLGGWPDVPLMPGDQEAICRPLPQLGAVDLEQLHVDHDFGPCLVDGPMRAGGGNLASVSLIAMALTPATGDRRRCPRPGGRASP